MIDLLLFAFSGALILIVWFETDAFEEYMGLFNVGGLYFDLSNYRATKERIGISYTDYLSMNYNNFFINLITCPICLGIWINLIFSLKHRNLMFFVVGCYTTIILYFIFKILMKKSDESV